MLSWGLVSTASFISELFVLLLLQFLVVSLQPYRLRGYLHHGRCHPCLWKSLRLLCHLSGCSLQRFAVFLGLPVPRDKALLYNCDGWGSTQQLARSNNLDNVHSVGGSTLLSRDLVTSP